MPPDPPRELQPMSATPIHYHFQHLPPKTKILDRTLLGESPDTSRSFFVTAFGENVRPSSGMVATGTYICQQYKVYHAVTSFHVQPFLEIYCMHSPTFSPKENYIICGSNQLLKTFLLNCNLCKLLIDINKPIRY